MKQTVKVDLYTIIGRAVEEGLRFGYRRAHKHTDTPPEEQLLDYMEAEVMSALSEVINFEEEL